MKVITLSELEANIDKYIEMVQEQDFLIAVNGRVVAKLTAYKE